MHVDRFGIRDEIKVMEFEYIEVFYNWKRLHSTPVFLKVHVRLDKHSIDEK